MVTNDIHVAAKATDPFQSLSPLPAFRSTNHSQFLTPYAFTLISQILILMVGFSY